MTVLLDIRAFIGHFHPVIVHLPIGILLLAVVLQGLARREKPGQFHKAISVSLLLGAISAILACVSGYLLSLSDDYDAGMINRHFWFGCGVAGMAVLLCLLHRKGKWMRWQWRAGLLMCVLVIVTGHLGGSLTHGAGYLTQPLMATAEKQEGRKVIPNVQEAQVYADVIQPLLQQKCYSCHNAGKRKGGLQMHEPDLLMRGGKNGKVIIAGKPEESELIRRILLPSDDEKHMPPKEKPQPSEHDMALLHWWIAAGAPFDKKVKELEQPEKIKPVLLALQQGTPEEVSPPDIPASPVEQANENAVQQLRQAGVVVLPVAQNSNYLMVNAVTADSFTNRHASLLLPLKKQLVWLKLGNTAVGDSALAIIGQCTNLTRLQLEYTGVTDAGLAHLQGLKGLRYLNLVGTGITDLGIRQLKGLPNLKSIYLYQSRVNKNEWPGLQKLFPGTYLDSGGYVVPLLETDTTEVRYMPQKG